MGSAISSAVFPPRTTLDERPEVLVVEDDEDEVWFVGRALQRHGMERRFKIVRSGEDALRYLRSIGDGRSGPQRPKVVFLDLKLTGIGGHEVLRQIRADERLSNLPVVIVSSSISDKDVNECYRLGANSFVPKRHGDPPGEYLIDVARYWLELNRSLPPSLR